MAAAPIKLMMCTAASTTNTTTSKETIFRHYAWWTVKLWLVVSGGSNWRGMSGELRHVMAAVPNFVGAPRGYPTTLHFNHMFD